MRSRGGARPRGGCHQALASMNLRSLVASAEAGRAPERTRGGRLGRPVQTIPPRRGSRTEGVEGW